MDLTEKTIETEEIFRGKLLDVFRNRVRLPNGAETTREIIRHPGGACVLALDDEMNVSMVRQFRYPYGTTTLELPAGKIDAGEDPLYTAARELREEAGLISDEIIEIGEMYPSPGYTDEVVYLYLALDVKEGKQRLEEDEFLNIEKMFLGDAIKLVFSGEIKDAKTQICLLKVMTLLENIDLSAIEDGEDDGGDEITSDGEE